MSHKLSISESLPVEEESFDSLLTSIGFGKWQVIMLMLAILPMSIFPVHLLGDTLLNAHLPFRCLNQTDLICDRNNGENCLSKTDNETYFNNVCFESILDTALNLNNMEWNLTEGQEWTSLDSCPVIEYDRSTFTSTIFSEFHLVCENEYLQPMYVFIYTIGNMIGSIFGGYIGDRWGRLMAIRVGTAINLVSVIAMVLVPNYHLLLLMRFFTGWSASSTLVSGWSAGLESTPSKHRTIVGMFLGLPFSIFLIAFAGMGYFIRTWKILLLAAASPALLLLLISFIASESPRWLLLKGRLEDARKVLHTANKLNGREMTRPVNAFIHKLVKFKVVNVEPTPATPKEKLSLSTLVLDPFRKAVSYFRYPAMRTIFLAMAVIWILHDLLFVGVALNDDSYSSGNPFIYVALTGVMDASAILVITPITYLLGRRIIILIGFLGSGVLFFVEIFIPNEYGWLRYIVVMAGFFLVAGSLQVNYMYTPEVFPTEIRARGFAFVQVLANVGNSIAPFVTINLAALRSWAPGVVFGCAGIIGGLLLPLLPETKNQPLPDTVQDVEARRKKKKMMKKEEVGEGTDSEEEAVGTGGTQNKAYIEEASSHL